MNSQPLPHKALLLVISLALIFSVLGITPMRAVGGPPYMYIANHEVGAIVQVTLTGAWSATMSLGGLISGPSAIALDVANSR